MSRAGMVAATGVLPPCVTRSGRADDWCLVYVHFSQQDATGILQECSVFLVLRLDEWQ